MLPFVDQLLPVLIGNIYDKGSLRKQEMAVRTLGQLVSATGYVVRPYLQYPQLLPMALDLLVKNSSHAQWSLRREILRTLGLLGALDPHKYSIIVQHLFQHGKSTKTDAIGGGSAATGVSDMKLLPSTSTSAATVHDSSDSKVGSAPHLVNATGNSGNGTILTMSSGVVDISIPEVRLDEAVAETPAYLFMYEQSVMRTLSVTSVENDEPRLTPANDDFYPRVAIASLMRVLRDGSLGVHHSSVTQAIMFIFKSMGLRSVPFLDQIIPYLLQIVKRCGPGLRESLLQQLSQLAAIVKNNLSPYIAPLFELISEFWQDHLEHSITLVEEVALSVGDDFSPFLDRLLQLLLTSLVVPRKDSITSRRIVQKSNVSERVVSGGTSPSSNASNRYRALERTLVCVDTLRHLLRTHIALLVPALCKLISQLQDIGIETLLWQSSTVRTLHRVCAIGGILDCPALATRVVQVLCRTVLQAKEMINAKQLEAGIVDKVLQEQTEHLYGECVSAICCVARQLGPRFIAWDRRVRDVMQIGEFTSAPYEKLITSLKKTCGKGARDLPYRIQDVENISRDGWVWFREEDEEEVPSYFVNESFRQRQDTNIHLQQGPGSGTQRLAVNQQQLQRSWDVTQRTTADDWDEWLRRFSVELLRESPSPALRSCSALAQAYTPLAKELFHASFVSCWQELTDQYRDSLIHALQTAFKSTSIPPEILQMLLNLAEFMEHDVEPLPIDPSTLAELAQKSHAYAKALHYRELEFVKSPTASFESLISINKKLDQYDAALGVLKVVQQLQKQQRVVQEDSLDNQSGDTGTGPIAYAVHEAWLAKLGHWDEALAKYQARLDEDPTDKAAVLGSLKCLDALGRWEDAITMCTKNMGILKTERSCSVGSIANSSTTDSIQTQSSQQKAAVIGAQAAWSLREWSIMQGFVTQLPEDNIYASFMRSVLSVHEDDFSAAAMHIDHTRKQLDESLSALMAESYSRAYVPLVMLQQLSELEEIMEFKPLLHEAGLLPKHSEHRSDSMSTQDGYTSAYSRMRSIGRPGGATDVDEDGAMEEANLCLQSEVLSRKAFLVDKWRRRIQGCRSSGRAAIPVWKNILNVRRMVLSDREDLDTWLDFATSCRRGGNVALSKRVLNMKSELQGCLACEGRGHTHTTLTHGIDPGPNSVGPGDPRDVVVDRKIRFAILRQLWTNGLRDHAIYELDQMLQQMDTNTDSELHLACLLKLGQWKLALVEPGMPIDGATRRATLNIYSRATHVQNQSYNAWHEWGLANYRGLEETRTSHNRKSNRSVPRLGGGTDMYGGSAGFADSPVSSPHRSSSLSGSQAAWPHIDTIRPFIVGAAKGLLRAITLGTRRYSSSVTQDMLCVLNIWFRYGHLPDVAAAIESGLSNVHMDNWLGVLPQLIARIHHPEESSRNMLHNLLRRLGAKHAQALVYPLFVALKSPREDRRAAAEVLMSSLRQNSSKLVDQALLVSQELIRVAILWQEVWHEALEEASRQFFGEGNVQSMLDTLLPLHQELEVGPTTILEESFYSTYIAELQEAHECLKQYLRSMQESGRPIPVSGAAPGEKRRRQAMGSEEKYVVQAWDSYYNVFKRINLTLPQITSLELQYVSPALLNARDLVLAVPGSYCVNGTCIRIQSFHSTVLVIRSKQRPRKIRILGEDGNEFVFLLKGHEDLRQDERVMQLFGLVNALLYHGRGTENHELDIQRYPVMPLSPNTGVVGWVPQCDTLHDLIRDYRDRRKIMLNTEHKLMQQLAPNNVYDTLTTIQKLEIFEHALENSAGDDLHKILWYRSETSEAWLQRRSNYTKSLAVMSMVGYVLGLGDRHPSNLMLHRDTGKILHIDFGDCFEVAMHRDKFPETIPFRLTRMLVQAMEVSGVEGTFRLACEKVMSVLRESKDSLIATLEAFVHDPLISWRLLNPNSAHRFTNKAGLESQVPEHLGQPGPASIHQQTTIPTLDSSQQAPAIRPGGGIAGNSYRVTRSVSRLPTLETVLERGESTLDLASADQEDESSGEAEDRSRDSLQLKIVSEEVVGVAQGRSLDPGQGLRGAFASQNSSLVKESPLAPTENTGNQAKDTDFERTEVRWASDLQSIEPSQGKMQAAVQMGVPDVSEWMNVQTTVIRRPVMSDLVGQTAVLAEVTADSNRISNYNTQITSMVPIRNSSTTMNVPPVTRNENIIGHDGAGDIVEPRASSYRPNLHLEIMGMAALSSQGGMRLEDVLGGSQGAIISSLAASFAISSARHRSVRERALQRALGLEGADAPQGELTEKAVAVIRRVMDKLTGMDFAEPSGLTLSGAIYLVRSQVGQNHGPVALDVADQVDRLILQASSNENLCLCFFGWCPFW